MLLKEVYGGPMKIEKVAFRVWSLRIDNFYIECPSKKDCMNELAKYTRKQNRLQLDYLKFNNFVKGIKKTSRIEEAPCQ